MSRYQILQNYLGKGVEHHFMCYYLIDSSIKDYFGYKGFKLVKWSYNGAELYEMAKSLNKE